MSTHPQSDEWSDYDEAYDDKPPSVELVRWYAHPPMRLSGVLIGIALAGAFALGAFTGSKSAHAGHWVKDRMPGRNNRPTKH